MTVNRSDFVGKPQRSSVDADALGIYWDPTDPQGEPFVAPMNAHDASAISVLDTAGNWTATDVEGVLAEVPSRFTLLDPSSGGQDLSALVADLQAAGLANLGASGAAPGVSDGGAPFSFHDVFDGSSGTNISSYTPAIGTAWTAAAGNFQLDGSGGAKRSASTRPTIATVALGADTVNYDIDFSISIPNTTGVQAGVILHYTDSTNFLCFRCDELGQRLTKRVAGTDTYIATFTNTALINTTKRYRIEVRGAQISVFEQITGYVGSWTLKDGDEVTYGSMSTIGIGDFANAVSERYVTFNHFAVTPAPAPSIARDLTKVAKSGPPIIAALAASSNAGILVVGDSTGDDVTVDPEWVKRFASNIADSDASIGVDYHKWTLAGGWPAATAIQSGTPKVVVMNASVASQASAYFNTNWSSVVSSIPATPLAVIINLGHNETFGTSTMKANWRTLLGNIRSSYAGVPILLVAQNAHKVLPWESVWKRRQVVELAMERDLDLLDIWSTFGGQTPDTATNYLSGDNVHPTANGHKLWASAAFRAVFPAGITPN